MKILVGKQKQHGAMVVEFALVLFMLCALFVFVSDLSHQLLVRSQLDRASFSLVNILKERTRYYGSMVDGKPVPRFELSQRDISDMQRLAGRLLDTPVDDVAISIEAIVDNDIQPAFTSAAFRRLGCVPVSSMVSNRDLVPVENGKAYPLYRVTLCSPVSSWFAPFMGMKRKNPTVVSSSIMPGR
ncbi:tight adherence pilus pseudopilin TadF [Photobacterium aquae]|uniref:tight adherence pilus pseudopilin TadF n=1 Tax=Photobacterium aquae TaxID=1195763 RepID=UPI00069DF7FA|nr:tight adherence pilus pseudopilin TadF [Photobacterium aquae]